MSIDSDRLRDDIWRVITTVESRGLFVHAGDLTIRHTPSRKSKTKTFRLPLIVGSAVLNALVPRSAMLLVGGHGGGKTTLIKLLGRMMTGKTLNEIEDGVLRGHPQLTEEKMVATLKPGPLMKDGVEVVVWRRFVTGFWKMIDEVNRLTPHAQNILLSMLAEGELKYYDEIKRCEDFCLYATMNPTDAGTFDMAPPFLDRFGMAVPITMPTVNDLELILASRDEKLFGYDELWQVPAILSEEDLLTIWNLADKMPVSEEASEFMRSVVREFGACIRVDKSQSSDLTIETGLCDGCHFNTSKSVCNKVLIPLSVRAAKDLNRYCKAVAWLIGGEEVSIDIVKSIAPLVFWHRTKYSRDELEKSPYYGNRFIFTENLVELASTRFAQRDAAMQLIHDLRHGTAESSIADELREMGKSDILVRMDYLAFAKELKKKKYIKMVKSIEKSIKKGDVDTLTKLHSELLDKTDFPNRSMLLNKVSEAMHKLTLSQFSTSFDVWQDLWTIISIKHPRMTSVLKETLNPPKRKVIRTDGLTLIIYVTGDSPESKVFLEISGGSDAVDLKEEIKEQIGSEDA
ncbi:MAG: AAA domain-containing protein [Candidatus Lokiarchaeota archaeon]|nr:AAA domain-containing protein [Candidatus Lokiarchaeota archaeon]